MKDQLDKIEGKIDKLDERLDRVENVQIAMSKDLSYHIKRTDILEKQLLPIRNKHQQMVGVLKLLGWVAAIAGVVEVILRFALHT